MSLSRWIVRLLLLAVCLAALPRQTPAPLIFRPGEGWIYEPVGGAKWTKDRAEDQLAIAKGAFEDEDYKLAARAARRTVRQWPLSDFAPDAQYLLARSYEEIGKDEKAFKAYQRLIDKYPRTENYQEVLQRQYQIAHRFLEGQWFKLWGVIPFFPSMDKTVELYEQLVQNGPFSPVAPAAQMDIGAAREKQKDFAAAVKAYEKAADRYHDQQSVAADAVYKAGMAYLRQAKTAEYDQSIAGKAIETFTDFTYLYPNDPRVEEARQIVAALRTEQARGNFQIARYYEKRNLLDGALVYYNEAVLKDPDSLYAQEAREKIAEIQKSRAAAAGERQTAEN